MPVHDRSDSGVVTEEQFLKVVKACLRKDRPIAPSRVVKARLTELEIVWDDARRSGCYLEAVERSARQRGVVHAWNGVFEHSRMNGWSLPGPGGEPDPLAVEWAARNGWARIP